MLPKSHARSPFVIVQSCWPLPPSIDQSRPALVGSGSSRCTSLAVPGPAFATVIRNPTWSAASTVVSSATFVTEIAGQLTVIVTLPVDGLPSLPVVALALFTTLPQVADVVGELMCTVLLAPGSMSSKEQVNTPCAIAHWAAPVPPSIVQPRPAFVGRMSVTTTLVAVPAPLFVTVMVYPIVSPALTTASSATFEMTSAAHLT